MSPAIELRDVHKRYGTVSPVDALRNVSLTIDDGELVSIIGPSGSGKTTLLHVMGALLRPTSGTVRIGGTTTSSLSDRALSALRAHQLGFVFQDYVLIAGASALGNVADGLLYCGIARRECLARSRGEEGERRDEQGKSSRSHRKASARLRWAPTNSATKGCAGSWASSFMVPRWRTQPSLMTAMESAR